MYVALYEKVCNAIRVSASEAVDLGLISSESGETNDNKIDIPAFLLDTQH